MTRWIELREKLPPVHMEVLFYIRDEENGFTEDYCVQRRIYEDGKITLKSGDLEKCEKVSHWTLLPSPPVPWM